MIFILDIKKVEETPRLEKREKKTKGPNMQNVGFWCISWFISNQELQNGISLLKTERKKAAIIS